MAKFDFGGAAGGAVTGASLGSTFGPIGTGIGAVGGGILGGLFGGKSKPKKTSSLDKRQQALYDEYVRSLMGNGRFSDSFNFNPDQVRDLYTQMFANPAYQQFQEEILPSITGAFRGGNLENSSYLADALAKAGTRVQSGLNAQLANMLYNAQDKSIDRRLDAVRNILGTQTFAMQKPQPSPFDSLLSGLTQHGGQYLANKFMPLP